MARRIILTCLRQWYSRVLPLQLELFFWRMLWVPAFSSSNPHCCMHPHSSLPLPPWRSILILQTQNHTAKNIQYIAQSTVTLPDGADLGMMGRDPGIGNPGDVFHVCLILFFFPLGRRCRFIFLLIGGSWKDYLGFFGGDRGWFGKNPFTMASRLRIERLFSMMKRVGRLSL